MPRLNPFALVVLAASSTAFAQQMTVVSNNRSLVAIANAQDSEGSYADSDTFGPNLDLTDVNTSAGAGANGVYVDAQAESGINCAYFGTYGISVHLTSRCYGSIAKDGSTGSASATADYSGTFYLAADQTVTLNTVSVDTGTLLSNHTGRADIFLTKLGGPLIFELHGNGTTDGAALDGQSMTLTAGSYSLSLRVECGGGPITGEGSAVATVNLSFADITTSCPGDFDNSGGTPDITDIDAFFTAWLAGEPSADIDNSGGTPDITDIGAFFDHWLAGC